MAGQGNKFHVDDDAHGQDNTGLTFDFLGAIEGSSRLKQVGRSSRYQNPDEEMGQLDPNTDEGWRREEYH
jgi:hypothetical protein